MAIRQTLTWLKRVFLVAAFAALPSAPVWAGACASGATCTIDLFNVNIFNTSPGDIEIHIAVTINNTGPTTVLTFAWVSDNLTNNPLGIDQVAWSADVLASAPLPAGWGHQGGPSPYEMDGFGDFAQKYTNPGGTDLSVSFTLASLVTLFPDNNPHAGQIPGEFAVHIRYDGDCSAYVSDATAAQTQKSECTPIRHEGPEPGSLLLLGIGILALGLARRRMSARM
jgi:hypothetical protein